MQIEGQSQGNSIENSSFKNNVFSNVAYYAKYDTCLSIDSQVIGNLKTLLQN